MSNEKKKNRYREFKEQALSRPEVRRSFEEGLDTLRLAVRLAELREKRGLTQTQLAAMLNTSPSVISRIENGGDLQLKTLQKIAKALNVKLMIEFVEVEDSSTQHATSK